jgi:PAS domain-containing protein
MRDVLAANAPREGAEASDARARLAEALDVSMDGIVLTDAAGRITAANRRASRLLPDLALVPGGNWNRSAAALDVPDPATAAALWHAPPAAAEVRLPGGRWLRISRSPARGGGAIAILSDITGGKAHEAALSESNRRFSAAIGNMAQGLCMVDAEGRILVCNQRFCDMFGLPPAELMAGVPVRDASRIAMEAARYPLDLLAQVKEDQRSLKEGSKPASVVREGEGGAALATAYEPMPGGGWVATYADVSERRAGGGAAGAPDARAGPPRQERPRRGAGRAAPDAEGRRRKPTRGRSAAGWARWPGPTPCWPRGNGRAPSCATSPGASWRRSWARRRRTSGRSRAPPSTAPT